MPLSQEEITNAEWEEKCLIEIAKDDTVGQTLRRLIAEREEAQGEFEAAAEQAKLTVRNVLTEDYVATRLGDDQAESVRTAFQRALETIELLQASRRQMDAERKRAIERAKHAEGTVARVQEVNVRLRAEIERLDQIIVQYQHAQK
jgi:hypothetical protein